MVLIESVQRANTERMKPTPVRSEAHGQIVAAPREPDSTRLDGDAQRFLQGRTVWYGRQQTEALCLKA